MRRKPAPKPTAANEADGVEEADRQAQIDELVEFFSECVITDKKSIKEKLQSTADIRKFDMQHERKIFNQIVKLYAVSPELVVLIFVVSVVT